jgi:hypothetical protein
MVPVLTDPQPVKALMAAGRWLTPPLYEAIVERRKAEGREPPPYELIHLCNVLARRTHPHEELKADLAEFFGKPIEELLHPGSLTRPYRDPYAKYRRTS